MTEKKDLNAGTGGQQNNNDTSVAPLEPPIAHQNLEADIKQYGLDTTIKRLKKSFDLLEQYPEVTLIQIKQRIIKGEMFAYLFMPKHTVLFEKKNSHNSYALVHSEPQTEHWRALTSSEAYRIFNQPNEPIQLFLETPLKFSMKDLWVNLDDVLKMTSKFKEKEARTKGNNSLKVEQPSVQNTKEFSELSSTTSKKIAARPSRVSEDLLMIATNEKKLGRNFPEFKKMMLNTYLFDNVPTKDEAYSVNEDLCTIYVTLENGSYLLHYTVRNNKGDLIPLRWALCSFYRYFTEYSKDK